MLLWSWKEHRIAARLLGESKTRQVVMLVDELESHLHPRWQRSILRALMDITKVMHKQAQIQLVTATHSPLILASAEPIFNPDEDAWFDIDFDEENGKVELNKRPFHRRGTVGRWLTSPAFDLQSEGRSLEAEQAISEAEILLRSRHDRKRIAVKEVNEIDVKLRQVLPDIDRFWVRWSAFVDDLRGAQ
jgi:AAA15 family ATPase/GTPase